MNKQIVRVAVITVATVLGLLTAQPELMALSGAILEAYDVGQPNEQ